MWKGLRADGLRGVKFDYPESAWAKDGGFEDKTYTTTSAYRQLFQLCSDGLGPDALYMSVTLANMVHLALM